MNKIIVTAVSLFASFGVNASDVNRSDFTEYAFQTVKAIESCRAVVFIQGVKEIPVYVDIESIDEISTKFMVSSSYKTLSDDPYMVGMIFGSDSISLFLNVYNPLSKLVDTAIPEENVKELLDHLWGVYKCDSYFGTEYSK